jgi:hypothetical protein
MNGVVPLEMGKLNVELVSVRVLLPPIVHWLQTLM